MGEDKKVKVGDRTYNRKVYSFTDSFTNQKELAKKREELKEQGYSVVVEKIAPPGTWGLWILKKEAKPAKEAKAEKKTKKTKKGKKAPAQQEPSQPAPVEEEQK